MVSVIVPVYNVRLYIQRCLESLVNQTLKDIEIIIVDDGSTDGSGEFVDAYASGYPDKIRVIHKKNGGLMSAWTLGVRESKGEYIGFVDSDDAVDRLMYEKLLSVSVNYDADIVWCDSISTDNVLSTSDSFKEGLYKNEALNRIKSCIFPTPGNPIVSNARWNKLYKRHLIIDNLRYTECLSRTFEDRYIVPASVMSAKSLYYLKEPLYIYTQNRIGCNSQKYNVNLWDEVLRMYDIQKQMLEDKKLMQEFGECWERSFFNCIRVYVGRNVVGVKGLKARYHSSERMLNDSITKERFAKYGKIKGGYMEKAINMAVALRSPLCLSLLTFLTK